MSSKWGSGGGDGGGGVQVEPESVIARYAEYHARLKRRPIGAIGALGGTRRDVSLFVENELLIAGEDRELGEELRERYGAELIEDLPIPQAPARMRGRRPPPDPRSIPRTTTVRFRKPPRVTGMRQLLDQALGDRRASASSEMAASVAAVAARHRGDRRSIGLNFVGEPLAMPLAAVKEGSLVADPFTWLCFNGRIRVVEAWQLIDSIRRVRGDQMVWLGVLDEGFWLNDSGAPNVSMSEAVSDFGLGVMQVNLINENEPVGGPTGFAYRWHGNAVASVAAGRMNDSAGVAGTAGNTATPVLFRTSIEIKQMIRCAKICAAWGIDVLNISVGTWDQDEIWFPTSEWNRAFQFAADNDVVIIAAAGNDNLDLPDDRNIRPATRTPGVLTVGALDLNEQARANSNHGSSVGLWAPGTSIAAAPDGDNATGSQRSGTSYAAPFVAGVAAMMRYANPQLGAHDIRSLLVNTGWQGQGHVTKGLDAYAAVLAAIGHKLPDNEEPNNTPHTAKDLIPVGPAGALVPVIGVFTAKASASDFDYWKFQVREVSAVKVTLEWYERLSSLTVVIETDDPDVQGIEELAQTGDATSGKRTLSGILSPAHYRVRVGGGAGQTAYQLLVDVNASNLPRDDFEVNDSFETAAHLIFEPRPKWSIIRRESGPGTFNATLHRNPSTHTGRGTINDDYFELEVPAASTVLHIPEVSIADADIPLDVTLYDSERRVIKTWPGVRRMFAHPPGNSTCFLKVTGPGVSRYRISTRMTSNRDALPGPHQRPYEVIPDWWRSPGALVISEREQHLIVGVHTQPGDGDALVFEHSDPGVAIDLLDRHGEVVGRAEGTDGRLSIDTSGIEPGAYVVRVRRGPGAPVRLNRIPPLR